MKRLLLVLILILVLPPAALVMFLGWVASLLEEAEG